MTPSADARHTPAFGLVFGAPPREINLSICFECNNLYVANDMVAFDATSPEARALLAFLRSRVPEGWSSDE